MDDEMRKIEVLIVIVILLALAALGGCQAKYGGYEQALKQAGVAEEDYEACMCWAFGDNFSSVELSSICDVWNERHPKLSIIFPSDTPYEAIYKVGKAWMTKQEQS